MLEWHWKLSCVTKELSNSRKMSSSFGNTIMEERIFCCCFCLFPPIYVFCFILFFLNVNIFILLFLIEMFEIILEDILGKLPQISRKKCSVKVQKVLGNLRKTLYHSKYQTFLERYARSYQGRKLEKNIYLLVEYICHVKYSLIVNIPALSIRYL